MIRRIRLMFMSNLLLVLNLSVESVGGVFCVGGVKPLPLVYLVRCSKLRLVNSLSIAPCLHIDARSYKASGSLTMMANARAAATMSNANSVKAEG